MFNEIQEVTLTSVVKNALLIILGLTLILLFVSIGYEQFVKVNEKLNSNLLLVTVLISLITFSIYFYFPRISMTTSLNKSHLEIKIGFLVHKLYQRKDIIEFYKVDFDPIKNFGGYGYRINGSRKAFIANGHKGVEIILKDQSILIMGTAKPKELLAALNQ